MDERKKQMLGMAGMVGIGAIAIGSMAVRGVGAIPEPEPFIHSKAKVKELLDPWGEYEFDRLYTAYEEGYRIDIDVELEDMIIEGTMDELFDKITQEKIDYDFPTLEMVLRLDRRVIENRHSSEYIMAFTSYEYPRGQEQVLPDEYKTLMLPLERDRTVNGTRYKMLIIDEYEHYYFR